MKNYNNKTRSVNQTTATASKDEAPYRAVRSTRPSYEGPLHTVICFGAILNAR